MSASFDSTAAAALLAGAMNNGSRIDAIPEAQRPSTLAEGYDIQDRIAAESLKGGLLRDKVAGWKLGLGSANAMKGAKLSRPLIGRVFAGRLHKNDVAIDAPAGATALIEIEIAFTLSRDVAPTESVANPLDVVGEANLVSEIVLSRFVNRSVVGLPSFAADSVGFYALVIGPKVSAGQIAAIARSVAVTLDGKPVVAGLTGDDAIDPVVMMGYLMAHARDRGITLRKGEIVTTGTLSKPFDAPVPSAIEAVTDGGTVRYTLKAV